MLEQKLIARFRKNFLGYKQDNNGNFKRTQDGLKIRIFSEPYYIAHTPMTRGDVKAYFRAIKPPQGMVGDYCERCGILIGKGHMNEKPLWFGTFAVCEECDNHLKNELPENTPDLADLKRFKLLI